MHTNNSNNVRLNRSFPTFLHSDEHRFDTLIRISALIPFNNFDPHEIKNVFYRLPTYKAFLPS